MIGFRRFFSWGWVFAVCLGGCTGGADAPGSQRTEGQPGGDVAEEVMGMLRASADSWNAGDLDGFLDDYWASEDLTFSGADGVTRGWDDVRQRYLDSYWAPGASRDSLRFQALEVIPLGEAHALALGQYVLYRPDSADSVSGTGHFSLVLQKVDGSWKIIHDHTSATPQEEG